MKLSTKTLGATVAITGALAAATAPQAAPNWAASPAKPVPLLYPGQSSWEWALTNTDHPGADKFRAGKTCAACHSGDEANMGNLMAAGKKNEPHPIPGKPGSMVATVAFSHDADTLYVKITFPEGGQPNAGMDPNYATKVTVMLAGAGAPEATRAGCWGMCHDDSAGMPSAGASDRTMYLGRTRANLTRQGGGDALRPGLPALHASGYFAEYWQARVNSCHATAVNGEIFDKRSTTPTVVSAASSPGPGGNCTVVLSRKLSVPGHLEFAPGQRYAVALSIHAGHTAKRFHYVSFERSMVIDSGVADFVAR